MLTLSSLCIISIILLAKTVMVIGNSVSNSGELNVISLMMIFALDQFGVRFAICGIFWLAGKIIIKVYHGK